jgi:hypothetical protein
MTTSRTDIDQQELEAAVVRLTESIADDDREATMYRNPLEVVHEEWRKKAYTPAHAGMRPEVKANWPTAKTLEESAAVSKAEESEEESFANAVRQWHAHYGQHSA